MSELGGGRAIQDRFIFAQDVEPDRRREPTLWIDTSDPARTAYSYSAATDQFERLTVNDFEQIENRQYSLLSGRVTELSDLANRDYGLLENTPNVEAIAQDVVSQINDSGDYSVDSISTDVLLSAPSDGIYHHIVKFNSASGNSNDRTAELVINGVSLGKQVAPTSRRNSMSFTTKPGDSFKITDANTFRDDLLTVQTLASRKIRGTL